MYNRRQPVFGGIAGGIFLIFLALAFLVHSFFLPLLFVGLAFSIFFGALSSGKSQATYGGIIGLIWILGLAVLYTFDLWWPGILILAGISVVVGTILRPMIGAGWKQGTLYQPSQQPQQPEQALYAPPPPYQGEYPPSYQQSDPYHQQSGEN
jgi:energy-coupling factor transporter transmembrane protein EcfT